MMIKQYILLDYHIEYVFYIISLGTAEYVIFVYNIFLFDLLNASYPSRDSLEESQGNPCRESLGELRGDSGTPQRLRGDSLGN